MVRRSTKDGGTHSGAKLDPKSLEDGMPYGGLPTQAGGIGTVALLPCTGNGHQSIGQSSGMDCQYGSTGTSLDGKAHRRLSKTRLCGNRGMPQNRVIPIFAPLKKIFFDLMIF